jgi:hypothetical protein
MNVHTPIPAASRSVTKGDNRPPSLIDLARESYRNLSAWLSDHPIITSHDEAKEAGKWIESVGMSLDELDAERRTKVDPLNAEVKTINESYRPVREAFENKEKRGLLDEIKRRLTAFSRVEEQRKAEEAERLRLEAEAAKKAAIDAEWAEEDAKAEADLGICDVDVGSAIESADAAFKNFVVADRQAARAERAIPTRIASAYGGRALTMRNKETLILDDAAAALAAIGVTEKIREAILSGARDYRKLNGALPSGVRSEKERSL